MDYSIKRNADIGRNKTAIIGISVMNIIFALAYFLEVVKGDETCFAPSFPSLSSPGCGEEREKNRDAGENREETAERENGVGL